MDSGTPALSAAILSSSTILLGRIISLVPSADLELEDLAISLT